LKRNRAPTEEGFRNFLAWLDEGEESNGEKYVQLRRRLVLYFDRKNCVAAEELADETLVRVAQKFAEQGANIDLSPAHYCYITAKFVFLEYLREKDRSHASVEDLVVTGKLDRVASSGAHHNESEQMREEMLAAIESCLKKFSVEDRELVLEYHRGEGRTKIDDRRRMAERLGISQNALSIRVCRLREKLEQCVKRSAARE
jgi:RNA polymerase sigma factor (sigma-70 family)